MTPNRRNGVHRRILVVEDDADGREAMRVLLETWGHDVAIAANGEDGIRLAVEGRPEIVLLDIGMPGMDGYRVAERIRAGENGDEPFLIAFTGWTREEDRRHAREAGCDTYVMKPIDPDRLRVLIAAAPANGRRRAEMR